MEDHHVDRPDVEARQRVQLTGTNRSFDLIVLITEERRAKARAEARIQNRVCAKARAELLVSGFSDPQFCFTPSFAGLVAVARRQDPIPSRTRPSNASAPMVLCLKTRESRSPPGLQRTEFPRHDLKCEWRTANSAGYPYSLVAARHFLPRGGAAR